MDKRCDAVLPFIDEWHQRRAERKKRERHAAVLRVLNRLKPNQEISADAIYQQFSWQVPRGPFRDVGDVEEILREMQQVGLAEFSVSACWKLRRGGPHLAARFASRF